MAKQEDIYVQFSQEDKFEITKFDKYPFNKNYNGCIFSICHNGVGYNWRLCVMPNGARFQDELANGKWSTWEDHKNVVYGLELIGGPLSSVSVDISIRVKLSDQSAATLHKSVWKESLFAGYKDRWVRQITTKQELEKDGSFANGLFRLLVEIKMHLHLFDPAKILQIRKEQISLKQENIYPVPSVFFDSIETQPAYGLSLNLICGAAKRVFYCNPQILEKNSEYFRNLLNSSGDFKEKKESKVEYPDEDPEGVRAALEYLYTKKIPENIKEVAAVCLPVAHLFLLPGLVLECERVLIGDLSAENDVEMAVTAQTYDLTLLKNMAMNSMTMHFEDVSENSDLKKNTGSFKECITLVACRSRSSANGTLKQD